MIYNNTNSSSKKYNIDIISLSTVLYIIPIFIYYVKCYYTLAYLGVFSSSTSFMYHITYEQSLFYLYLDMFFAVISFLYLLFDIFLYTTSFLEYYWYTVLISCSCICYLCGTGRKETVNRELKYTIFHTSWHLLLFILTTSHAYLKPLH